MKAFRESRRDMEKRGELHDKNLKDIHECLQQKEFYENAQNLNIKKTLGSPKNSQ